MVSQIDNGLVLRDPLRTANKMRPSEFPIYKSMAFYEPWRLLEDKEVEDWGYSSILVRWLLSYQLTAY